MPRSRILAVVQSLSRNIPSVTLIPTTVTRNWYANAMRNTPQHTNAYLVEQSGRSIREEWEDEARGAESVWERAAEYTGKVVEDFELLFALMYLVPV
ncbi:hypothetical protein BDN71DRAFT_250266 [Pleurotus eryngii]|uniref:Uncharacterized protein n=1 Tax=Pleurotus eryngii TaxID=5323 RepID=A0A9P5ZKB6_PLEER|nr:hypothetical protein BDN71DRAFT_250266 [Pleurotus eryngii]